MRLCGGAGLGALPRCAAGGRGCSRTEVERVSGKNESDERASPSVMQRWDYFKRVRAIRPNGFTYTSKGNKER